MSDPLVSVVIPAYNRPRKLERALQSVLDQQYSAIEIIVVDDYSSPPIREVLTVEDLPSSSIQIIRHDENRGGSAARNTGIDAAEGEYIAFLDDDDEWRKTKIDQQVRVFQSASEELGLVYTGIEQRDSGGKINGVTRPETPRNIKKRLLLDDFIGTFSSIMVRSEVPEAVGKLDERFPSWQDWEFYIRVVQSYEVRAIPDPLVIRHNEGEQISDNFERKKNTTVPLLIDKYRPLADEYGWTFKRKWLANLNFRLGYSALSNAKYDEGKRFLRRSIRMNPFAVEPYLYLVFAVGGKRTYEPARRLRRALVRKLN
ncbi:glycosyltransferase family 2 protein [Haloplanus salinarum]|uniref:glycosyltransferase family 2 protein n=1 Tax=Haloplanus salinarum TaxID=1912324 RepID=UPI00214C0724|nr:glycosyltransferase family A protein [Haloplanus salinarum]